jgi:hypothetical protein
MLVKFSVLLMVRLNGEITVLMVVSGNGTPSISSGVKLIDVDVKPLKTKSNSFVSNVSARSLK